MHGKANDSGFQAHEQLSNLNPVVSYFWYEQYTSENQRTPTDVEHWNLKWEACFESKDIYNIYFPIYSPSLFFFFYICKTMNISWATILQLSKDRKSFFKYSASVFHFL